MIRNLFLLTILMGAALSGCYEGWEYKQGTNPSPNKPKPKTQTKQFSYILLHAIYPDDQAIEDLECNISPARKNQKIEWDLRIKSLSEQLSSVADSFYRVDIRVSKEQCEGLQVIQDQSLSLEPWEQFPPPQQDKNNRATVQVVMVMWDEESHLDSPPLTVQQNPWQAWSNLKRRGRNTLSVRYFAMPDTNAGYFGLWRDSLLSTQNQHVLDANWLDPEDSTRDTLDKRDAIISQESTAFVEWLSQL